MIGDNYKRQDSTGAWAALADAPKAALTGTLAAVPSVKVATPDAGAAAILQGYTTQVAAEKAKTIGTATEALCLVRVPGESTNRSAGVTGCEAANTLARGSDAAQAVAQAFLAGSKRANFVLQNAGGVRIPVPAGTLTMNTAFTLLPYAAGLRWDLDMSQAKGSRFSNVQAKDRVTGAWSAINPTGTYVVATNDFIASGQDGCTTLGVAYRAGRYVNTYLLYTQTFADWVIANGSIARPARAEYSHQVVITRSGATLP